MLDHVGIGARHLDSTAGLYRTLGFRLTPYARHEGASTPGGPAVKLATGNYCAILETGYLEIISIIDSSLPDNGLAARIRTGDAVHIVALNAQNLDETRVQLRAAGFEASSPLYLERPATAETEQPGLAKFERVVVPDSDMPEIRMFYIRHLTPDLIWRRSEMEHPNTAVGILAVHMASKDPTELRSRLDRFLVSGAGNSVNRLGSPILEVTDLEAASDYFGALATKIPTCVVGLTIEVRSLSTLSQVLSRSGVPYRLRNSEIMVGPDSAGGVYLRFVSR